MNIRIITIALLLATLPVSAQKKKTVVNDSNTPLHLLQPAYQGTYGDLTPRQVKKDIDRVFAYIDKETPARVVDKNTGKLITDYTTMGEEAQLERGAFRLASYEWGVTYSALIAAAEATGDQRYMDYVQNRFRFLAEVAPHFRRVYEEKGTTDPQLLQILTPHALDDAGAVCAAMVKVRVKDRSLPVGGLIENYFYLNNYKTSLFFILILFRIKNIGWQMVLLPAIVRNIIHFGWTTCLWGFRQ